MVFYAQSTIMVSEGGQPLWFLRARKEKDAKKEKCHDVQLGTAKCQTQGEKCEGWSQLGVRNGTVFFSSHRL